MEPLIVNPRMITLARDLRYMNQKELTNAVNFTQGKLSKIENGLLRCSEDDIKSIANALKLPIKFFYQYDIIYGLGVNYRKKKTSSIKELKYFEALFQFRRMQITRLLKSVDIGEIDIKEFNTDDYTPSNIARIARDMWHIPSGKIENMVEVIENIGGIVFSKSVPDSKVDAMSQWINSVPMKELSLSNNYVDTCYLPLFFINTYKPMDRIRFSLAHELGHILMHKIPNENMEHEADEFAAEFLMPEYEIKDKLYNLSLDKLANLKLQWKVSMAALIHRAKELSCITKNQAKYMFIKLSSMGYKLREPIHLSPPKETPKLLKNIIDIYLGELNYTKKDIYNLLFLKNDADLYDFYDTVPRLHIIS